MSKFRIGWLGSTLTLFLAGSPALAADPLLKLTAVEFDPAGLGEIGLDHPLSIRVRYQSSQPLRLQASGSLNGKPIIDMTNASPVYPAGEDDALVWIAFRSPARIDAITITAADAHWQPLEKLTIPLSLNWTGNAPKPPQAPWVREMHAAQQRQISAAMKEYAASSKSDLFTSLLFPLMTLSVPLYLILQPILLWRNGFRSLAAVPLLLMIPVIGFSAFALNKGSNLWPIYLLLCSPVAAIYLLGVLVLRRRA